MRDEDFHTADHVTLQKLLVGQRQQDEKLAELGRKQDHTNGRISKLEKFQYLVTGGLIVLSIVVAPLAIRLLTGP